MNTHNVKDVMDHQYLAIYWDKFHVNQQAFCRIERIDYDNCLIIYKPFTFKPWFFKKRTIIIRGATVMLPHKGYIQVYFDDEIPMRCGDALTISTPFQKQYTRIAQPVKETTLKTEDIFLELQPHQ